MSTIVIVILSILLWVDYRRDLRRAALLDRIRHFLCSVSCDNGVRAPNGQQEGDAWAAQVLDEIDEEMGTE